MTWPKRRRALQPFETQKYQSVCHFSPARNQHLGSGESRLLCLTHLLLPSSAPLRLSAPPVVRLSAFVSLPLTPREIGIASPLPPYASKPLLASLRLSSSRQLRSLSPGALKECGSGRSREKTRSVGISASAACLSQWHLFSEACSIFFGKNSCCRILSLVVWWKMEKVACSQEAGGIPPLPSPPPIGQPHVKPERVATPKYSIISRHGVGTTGRRIPLLSDHFKVSVDFQDAIFYQYSVFISSENNRAIEGKGIGRKLIDRLYQTYSSELAGKRFAYDRDKSLYTVGPLLQNKFRFQVVLEESIAKCGKTGSPGGTGSPIETGKQLRCSLQSKTFKVELSYAAKIPLRSVALALKVVDKENNSQDALRVLGIILRQQAADRGCLLVRQSFFHDDSRNFTDIGGGVHGLWGFHSSF